VGTGDGASLWRHRVGSAITASPGVTLSADGEQGAMCCVCGSGGEVVVVAIPTGQGAVAEMVEVARVRLPADVFSSPVMVHSRMYVGCRDDHLYCVDLR
jgi:acyl-CoA synthetase